MLGSRTKRRVFLGVLVGIVMALASVEILLPLGIDEKSSVPRVTPSFPNDEFKTDSKTTRISCSMTMTVAKTGVELCNLGLSKNASQSSNLDIHRQADNAVDGSTDNGKDGKLCTHTAPNDSQPWWFVDLTKPARIHHVEITNRGDCCAERLNTIVLRAGNNTQKTENPICTIFDGDFGAGKTRHFTCTSRLTARYVSIHKNTPVLTLCEVNVIGLCE